MRLGSVRSLRPFAIELVLAGAAVVLLALKAAGASPTVVNLVAGGGTLYATVAVFFLRPRWLDGYRLVLIVAALWFLNDVYLRIGGDGVEYFVQARSMLFDYDLDFANDYEGLGRRPVLSANGETTSRFPVGVSLLWLPALMLAHAGALVASILGSHVATDGFSALYEAAATLATYVYGFGALVLMESYLRRLFGAAISLLTVLAVWLAAPLIFYMTANPSMSHGVSAFTGSLFVWWWLQARETRTARDWMWCGLAGGLAILVRLPDAALLLLPLIDLVWADRSRRLAEWGAFLAGPVLCAVVQTALWLSLYGLGFPGIVSTQSMVAASPPQVLPFLFSSHHGLLTWTPLYLGSVLGWASLLRRSRTIALSAALAFAASVLINSSTGDWWASESFGQRRLVGFVPLFALGLGASVEALVRRPLVAVAAVFALLIGWNLQLAYIFNGERIAGKDEALPFDRVVYAQVDVVYRKLLVADAWMPRVVWVQLYDALKGVWLFGGYESFDGKIDLGGEPAGFKTLVGDGWFEPQTEEVDGLTIRYRQSRGRRSWLSVPIRRAEDFQVLVWLRREFDKPGVHVRLDVNGHVLGEHELRDGWSGYRFDLDREVVRPGINQLTFVYSATPRVVIPDFHGRNATVAVDWIKFQRVN